jgi:hypothetical protein
MINKKVEILCRKIIEKILPAETCHVISGANAKGDVALFSAKNWCFSRKLMPCMLHLRIN